MLSQEERASITSEDCQMKTVIAHLRYRLRRELAECRHLRDEAQRTGNPNGASYIQERIQALEWAWNEAVFCERVKELMAQEDNEPETCRETAPCSGPEGP